MTLLASSGQPRKLLKSRRDRLSKRLVTSKGAALDVAVVLEAVEDEDEDEEVAEAVVVMEEMPTTPSSGTGGEEETGGGTDPRAPLRAGSHQEGSPQDPVTFLTGGTGAGPGRGRGDPAPMTGSRAPMTESPVRMTESQVPMMPSPLHTARDQRGQLMTVARPTPAGLPHPVDLHPTLTGLLQVMTGHHPHMDLQLRADLPLPTTDPAPLRRG